MITILDETSLNLQELTELPSIKRLIKKDIEEKRNRDMWCRLFSELDPKSPEYFKSEG